MTLKINLGAHPFQTEVELNSIIFLTQTNHTNEHNCIALSWNELKEIYHTFKELNSDWARDRKVDK